MYAIDWSAILSGSRARAATPGDPETAVVSRPIARRIAPTVWALGFTSLLTDVSSEMVASVLPMYLVLQLGISPVAFGIIDGLYQGIAALVRIAGGILADRWKRHKELASVGYGASAACRLLIIAAGAAWGTIAGVVAFDRLGKGLRTAPRDALISIRTRKEDLATAFGVHRALDAAGAFIGPIVAFLLLARMDRAFDVLFVASFLIALLGVAVITLFVEPLRQDEIPVTPRGASGLRGAAMLLRAPRFRALTICAFLLGMATISDSFIFLLLQSRLHSAATAFPLFYVGTSIATAMFAVPAGRSADRAGRLKVLIVGYVLLSLCYLTAATTFGFGGAVMAVLLLGAYYAATDGVLTAMAASELADEVKGSGLALIATSTNAARLAASVLFGALWAGAGLANATWWYFAALIVAIGCSLRILRGSAQAGVGDVAAP